jgi:O-antigen ligase
LFLTKDPASSKLSRFFGWACALAILLVSLRTASRTGLLTILLYAGVIFIAASIVNKLKMILAVVFFGVLLAATLPRQTLVRYSTMFTDPGLSDSAATAADDGVVASAEGSRLLRQRLFRYSLQMALQHPLFGVGMGNFAPVAEGISSKEQESTASKQPHSVYNQIAAEVGFPGLLLYVAMLVASFRACFRVRKATRGLPSQKSRYVLANCLLLTLLAFAVTNFLATSAYGIYLPIFTALAVLLERHVQPESRGNAAAPSASPFQVQSAQIYGKG